MGLPGCGLAHVAQVYDGWSTVRPSGEVLLSSAPHILLVVDEPQPDLRALLQAAGHAVTERLAGVLDLSESADEVSLVLLSLGDPEATLTALLAAQRRSKGDWVPLVVLASGTPEAHARWLDLGADEVLGRPVHPLELQARLARLLRQKERLASLTSERERLLQLSITDALTGLYNHGHFQTRLREECRRAHRYSQPLSLLILDLDHFKRINDHHGHPVGDLVLRRVSERLQQLVRETDMVARYGGEEFALLLPPDAAPRRPRRGAAHLPGPLGQHLQARRPVAAADREHRRGPARPGAVARGAGRGGRRGAVPGQTPGSKPGRGGSPKPGQQALPGLTRI